MKKPTDIQSLADRLTGAAATPVGAAPVAATPEPRKPRAKEPGRTTKSVYLRLTPELFAKIDAEAVNRTKASGRGVTVQQVIVEKLEGTV